jgi:hypothetical protein
MFVDRARAASELAGSPARRADPGHGVLLAATADPEAKEIFLGQICPGLEFATVDDWVRIYVSADSPACGPRQARSR